MHFEPIDRFDNARSVTMCDNVKDQSDPQSLFIESLCLYL